MKIINYILSGNHLLVLALFFFWIGINNKLNIIKKEIQVLRMYIELAQENHEGACKTITTHLKAIYKSLYCLHNLHKKEVKE